MSLSPGLMHSEVEQLQNADPVLLWAFETIAFFDHFPLQSAQNYETVLQT